MEDHKNKKRHNQNRFASGMQLGVKKGSFYLIKRVSDMKVK